MMRKLIFSTLSLAVAMSLNATVYATANGKEITEKELAPLLSGLGNVNIDALSANQKKELIDKGIELQLLIDEAKKSGVMDDDVYKKELEAVKDNLALRIWQAKEASKLKLDEKEISDFYAKNKAKFIEPAKIKASQIVLKTEAEANVVIKELKGLSGSAMNVKFADLAKAKSIDPQAKQSGGALGWMPVDQVKPFADAIAKVKDGQIAPKPIRSKVGYHVILKEGMQAKKQLGLDDVRGYIERVLRQQKAAKMVDQKATELRKNAKIEYK
jgi:foldase protein prsA